ncbi:hypothetical protein RhiirA1_389979 [Rhizophagus irregularis]|uniref:Uncharacterized protein n=1 Tax=Rhizophagus irregularis TaxID=588596 RepID=A0A2N0S9C4_9GLOM|nr:hypothetical protein RhiirA1_389979 [Rhizophagus irregularis]
MDERSSNEICDTFQETKECHALWTGGNYSKTSTLSSDFSHNGVGRDFFTMDVLHPSAFQNNVIKGSERLSCQNVGSFERQNFNDGRGEEGGSIRSSDNCEFNVFNEKTTTKEKETETNKEYRKIYVRVVDSLREKTDYDRQRDINKEPSSSEFKSGIDTGVKMVHLEYCSNRTGVLKMQASLGELLRNDALARTIRKEETSKKTCRFVFPINKSVEQDDNRSMFKMPTDYDSYGSRSWCSESHPMVIEQFKNESDCHNIATSFGLEIINNDVKSITSDIEIIKRYGFDHIIIIGMRPYGFLFMDCYGRVFDWDDMSGLLWPLGKVAESKISWLAWVVDSNETVVEIEAISPEQQRDNLLIAMKEKQHNTFTKSGKKKKNKKRHH